MTTPAITQKTTNKTTSKTTKKTALSPTLATITLAEARQCLETLNEHFSIIPAPSREQLSHAVSTVLATADALGIGNVKQLLENLPQVLKTITGVDSLTEPNSTEDINSLHEHRNVATALTVAAAVLNGCDTDPVFAHAVRLPRRSARRARPCQGDEILLLRLHAFAASQSNPTSKPAMAYALAEAGLYPSETTAVRLQDLDNPQAVTLIEAEGFHGVATRAIAVSDPFNQYLIARRAHAADHAGEAADATLSYQGRANAPGSNQASASVSGVIDRIMSQVGIKSKDHSDLTPISVTTWRIQTVFDEQGIEAAHELSGRRSHGQTLAMLFGTVKDLNKKAKPLILRFDAD